MTDKKLFNRPEVPPVAQALLDYLSFSEVKEVLLRFWNLQAAQGISSVAVLSESEGEGKSFVSALLAASVSRSGTGKRCLVVDAGAHFPVRSTLLEEAIEPLENVDLVQMGDSESGLTEILAHAQNQYELVVVDTCALGRRNRKNLDPLLLARQTSGAILVSSGKSLTDDSSVNESRRLLDAGVKVLGVMHNLHEIPDAPKGASATGRER